jgi:hypothetical protein
LSAIILDGLATAKAIKKELTTKVADLKKHGITPGLGTLLVGDDPGSHTYVSGKHRDCAEVGMKSIRIDLPASASKSAFRTLSPLFNILKIKRSPSSPYFPKRVDDNSKEGVSIGLKPYFSNTDLMVVKM